METIELLAPARDLECGRAAIDCGADAIYLGAPRFGAREAAGNSLDDIAALVHYAHAWWAKVYVTLNTLLFDREIPEAVRLAWKLYELGIDGLIIQDTGLLECELPPVPLIASTQMHNATPERVAFLEQVGLRRAILARELSLEQIREIRAAAPRIELECFIHGALCVGMSGQCYLSYALGGRSGNRGQCAQPCRRLYTLADARGRKLVRGHLLSLRDLNLTEHLGELLGAGVRCFKIEGRLKDRAYVANIVAHFRARLDSINEQSDGRWRRASSGRSRPDFTSDPSKTFNRGFCTFNLRGRGPLIGSTATPKMVGEPLGQVLGVRGKQVMIDTAAELHAGDGLSYFDHAGELQGTTVNAVAGRVVTPDRPDGLEKGIMVYRNHDHAFLTALKSTRTERRIAVAFRLWSNGGRPILAITDEDGVAAEVTLEGTFPPAEKPERALETIRTQLGKTGGTIFGPATVEVEIEPPPFIPVATLNALRREALERLTQAREAARPKPSGGIVSNEAPFPERELSYLGNVLNRKADAFYRRHGVTRIEPAAESGLDLRGRRVMTSKYCLKHQLGWCARFGGKAPAEPLTEPLALVDETGCRLELRFDCSRCEMGVYFGRTQ